MDVLIHFLQNTTEVNLRANSAVERNDTHQLVALEIDREFYRQIPKKSIKQLYDKIYATDFQMFGYKYPQEYIDMGHGV